MSVKRDIRFRVYISFTFMVLLGLAIILKAINIQASEGGQLRAKAERAHIRNQILPAERGNIYDEEGTVLSSTIPQFDLRIDFSVINKDTFSKNVDSLSKCIAGLFKDETANEYKIQLKSAFNKKNRYWLLRKNAPYYQYQAVRSFPILNKGKNRGGFIAEINAKRENPYGMLAYRTIGLWRPDFPNIGLEKTYDSLLSGKPGARIIRKTTGAVWMPMEGSEVDPVNGKDIVTTIDINIQDIAEHALLDIVSKYECLYGTAIVMEVKTGKILALANLGRQKDGSYWEDYNYALLPSEPGSTFKLFSLLSMLDDGYININSTINVNGGRRRFGNQTVVDDHSGMGVITVKKALEVSSNVAFATMIDKYYHDDPMKFIRHLQSYGLNKKTGIDLVGERSSLIKTTQSKSWNKVTSLPWIGYGYESLITPLHTCMVYNAVANNGRLMKPYLVSEIKEYGKVIKTINPVVLNPQIAKPSSIKQAQEALHGVVEEGTARGIKSPFYTAAGKTGTAQVADKGISYSDGVRQGSFVGYFPYEKPQYTIMVLVRSKPHGVYYGAVIGAPVFKAIADKLYASHIGGWSVPADSVLDKKELKDVTSTSENLMTVFAGLGWKTTFPERSVFAKMDVSADNKYNIQKDAIIKNKIPDLSGMGLKDALYLLETLGLHVTVSGVGKVINQSLQVGDNLVVGQSIHLNLG